MSNSYFEAFVGDAGEVMNIILYCLTVALMLYFFHQQNPVNGVAFDLCFTILFLVNCINDLYSIIKSPWSIVLVFARLYFMRLLFDGAMTKNSAMWEQTLADCASSLSKCLELSRKTLTLSREIDTLLERQAKQLHEGERESQTSERPA